jgi:NDP-sugar pyrophosphorylase family protein
MTIAAILAGGLGTRLRPVISDLPKVLAPIRGKPFLFFLLETLKASGVDEVVLLTGYMHEKVEQMCGDGNEFGLKISYSPEISPLGTAGALKNAEVYLSQHKEFLVLNGDSYAPEAILQLTRRTLTENEFGLIAVSFLEHTDRFGTIEFDPSTMAIQHFKEKLPQGSGYVNAGVYRLSRDILKKIPEQKASSLEQEIFPELLNAMPGTLWAQVIESCFEDIGLPESYAAFSSLIEGSGDNEP